MRLNFQQIFERPWRLAIFVILTALAFLYGRFILFVILAGVLLFSAIKSYFVRKKSYFMIVIPSIIFVVIVGIYYLVQYKSIAQFYQENYPPDWELVEKGTYTGTGKGLRGPIKVEVEVDNDGIHQIKILQHQEMIAALDGLAEQMIQANRVDIELVPQTIHGTMESSEGFRNAVADAIFKSIPERPELNFVTKLIHHFTQYRLDMTTLNALAILFCIVLVFDYTMQPALVPGTGQALNCYNCQTCVGACPVKIIDGEPYPMTMILAARLGNYEKVKKLAKYCVACSRCAGKCPVGDSGPSIAAAAISYTRKKRLIIDKNNDRTMR